MYPMKITELFDVCNSQSRFLVQQVFDRGYESDTKEGEIIDFSFIRFFSISLMYIDLLKRETTLTDEVFLS